jgi:hypothetical protein
MCLLKLARSDAGKPMLWSGDAPVFYVIDSRLYRREAAVELVRHFEMGQAA